MKKYLRCFRMLLLAATLGLLYFNGFSSGLSLSNIEMDDTQRKNQNDGLQSDQVEDITISGKVTDENGESLPSVNIIVSGTSIGTVTDVDGNYEIEVPNQNSILVFSFIGYITQEVKVEGRSVIDVELGEDVQSLEELIVVGYTSEKKKDVTGAITVVDVDEVQNIPTTSPMRALQGRVAGLYVQGDGNPTGSAQRIHVRGLNTLGNNSPLYVIDGVPSQRSTVFQTLNAQNIESIQVLKDAASSAIYGARGASGVIVVTTKQGKGKEKLNVNFNSTLSLRTEKPQRIDVLNTEQWGTVLWQAAVNDGTNPDAIGDIFSYDWHTESDGTPVLDQVNPAPFVGGDPLMPVSDTDWQDEFYNTGVLTKNDLTISSNSDKGSINVNLSHTKDDYMIANSTYYERFDISVNSQLKFFNNKLRVGQNTRLARTNQNLATDDLGGVDTPTLAVILAPTIPVFRTDGEYGGALGGGYTDRNNPLHMQHLSRWNQSREVITFGNVYAELELIDNLIIRSSAGLDYSNRYNKTINPSFQEGFMRRDINNMSLGQVHSSNFTLTNTIRYSMDFGRNNFNFLVGTEAIKIDYNGFSAYREDFAIQEENYFILDAGTGVQQNSQSVTGNRMLSYFGKVSWAFDNKYLASATIRRDGSSRFGNENKYGNFPALSLGWRISNENFFSGVDFITELKPRVSIGRSGNDRIGDFARFGLYRANYGALYSGTSYDIEGNDTGILPSGYQPTQGANDVLQWETTDELNVGIDMAFFDDKLTSSFDYFSRETSGILIRPPVSATLGEGQSTWYNGASTTNKGFEILLGYRNNVGGLSYSINTNVSHFLDEITELPEQVRTAYAGNEEKNILGRSQTSIFGYVTDGIFKSEDEVSSHADQPGKGVGRIRYKDLNDDGVIDPLDQDWLGISIPKYEYGVRINLMFKGFDFALFGSGTAGETGSDSWKGFNSFINTGSNNGVGVLDAWTPDNPNSHIPMLSLVDNNNERRASDYFWVNSSYFKLRNVTLGYSFPTSITQKLGIVNELRVFVMGDNIMWIKDNSGKDAFTGPDPEAIGGLYPIPTSITFGLNVSLN